MSLKYSVIKFVPDHLADEKINVGIVLIDHQKSIHFSIVENWKRVYDFAQNDEAVILVLKAWLDDLQQVKTEDELQKMMVTCNEGLYSILQFTEFRHSLSNDVNKTLISLTKIYLK